jgi:hypothetical protein
MSFWVCRTRPRRGLRWGLPLPAEYDSSEMVLETDIVVVTTNIGWVCSASLRCPLLTAIAGTAPQSRMR